MIETLKSLDDALLLSVNGANSAFFDTFFWLISSKWVWVPFYLALAYALWRRIGLRHTLLALAVIALLITFADQITSHVLRPIFERPRPTNPDNPISAGVHLVNGYRGGRFGFPSCHAANTFALATFCALLFRRRVLSLLLLGWAALVCYSRMYLGVHYLGDLLAGTVVGMLSAFLFYFAFCAVSKRLEKGGVFLDETANFERDGIVRFPALTLLATLLAIAVFAAV